MSSRWWSSGASTQSTKAELAAPSPRGETLLRVPYLIGCLALSLPRLVMAVMFLFTDYLKGPFETTFWPFMGFVFLPMTTLGFAASWHIGHGSHDSWGAALIALGLLYDLGIVRIGRRRVGGGRGGAGGGGGDRGDPPEDGGRPGGPGRSKEIVIEAEKVS